MTLKDIAEECGVSIMTVSNVINGKHSKVSAKTMKKVNDAIKRNNYVPNLSARSLSGNSSHIILIVIPYSNNIDDISLQNPYLAELVSVIERQLMINGYFTMIRTVFDPDDVTVMYRTWNIDGAIFLLPMFDESILKIDNYQSKHFLLMDSYADIKDVLCVHCNDYKGCYTSTVYLIEHGHRNIAFAAEHIDNVLLTARFNGYIDALRDNGIEYNPHNSIEISPTYDNGVTIGRTFRETHPDVTGIITTSDMCALGIIEGGRESGLSFPEDISIIGYDDIPLCSFSTPRLTTINQNIRLKGETAVSMLLAEIAGKNIEENIVTIDVHITERNSVKDI